jgi:hypothetical protein
MNPDKWSTVIMTTNFWWRLKFLFKPHDLIFCWGEDKWFTKGFLGQNYVSIGGVPDSEQHRFRQ